MLWTTCPCQTLDDAKIPHGHYQLNRNPNSSRTGNKGVKQHMTIAVVRKPYHQNLMTEKK